MTEKDEDDVALAGEYALHLMHADERRAFELRLESEPALRELVREWEEDLALLADEVPAVAPPLRIKGKIEARLFQRNAQSRTSWTGRIWPWIAGGALAAVLAAAIFVAISQPAPGPMLQAEIVSEDGSLRIVARFDGSSGTLEVERLEGEAQTGRVHELWLIADSAPGPISLGVLSAEERFTIIVAGYIAPALAGGTLAVSDEPPGGSPTGQPTGAVVAVGQFTG